jgi:hypothetical protein
MPKLIYLSSRGKHTSFLASCIKTHGLPTGGIYTGCLLHTKREHSPESSSILTRRIANYLTSMREHQPTRCQISTRWSYRVVIFSCSSFYRWTLTCFCDAVRFPSDSRSPLVDKNPVTSNTPPPSVNTVHPHSRTWSHDHPGILVESHGTTKDGTVPALVEQLLAHERVG